MNNFDAIIFDMDGILVDDKQSYWQTTMQTVMFLLEKKYNLREKVTRQDIALMKSIPGFNNEWDLSFTLVKLLAKKIRREDFAQQARKITAKERKTKEYHELKQLYQSLYLGNPPGTGMIMNESLLLRRDLLQQLARKYLLGIASSRPLFEMLLTLERLKITPGIIKKQYLVEQEDTAKEKPDPSPLLEAKKRMEAKNPVYIGDTINDVLAAKNAGMKCIYVGNDSWGDYRIKEMSQLSEILL